MKYECNVARDLMPLALDGAASEESQKLLHEHLEECADCKMYYAGMQAALPSARETSEREQQEFSQAARKVRNKRRRRLWQKILIGFLIGMVMMFGCLWGWIRLTNDLNVPMNYGNYDLFLSQLKDGSVAFTMDYHGSSRYMGVRIEKQQDGEKRILYVYNETTRIPKYLTYPNDNYSFMVMKPEYFAEIDEIRLGRSNEYAVVWQAGDSIPAASEEMETYFALKEEIMAIVFQQTEDGRPLSLSFEESKRHDELVMQSFAVKDTVPEWQ